MAIDDAAAAPLHALESRQVTLEGCVNFREVAGYEVAGGGRLRSGRLFRSDGLGRLTPGDMGVVRALGLRTVIDLRTEGEATEGGTFPVTQVPVDLHSFPLMDVLPAADELPSWGDPGFVARRYLAMVEAGGDMLGGVVRVLAGDGATPAVVHCSAGKDRTGVVVAVVLGMVGVPSEVIVADYARSASAMPSLLERLMADHPEASGAVAAYAPAILHAEPETMRTFVTLVERRFGGWAGLARKLGVDDAVDALSQALVDRA